MHDFQQGVEFSHYLFTSHVQEGDLLIDATAGNGEDTIFLANLTGPTGDVLAFEIQEEALRNAASRISKEGLEERVTLIKDGHENIGEYAETGSVGGILFNLGYLPGGDKDIITRPETTLRAMDSGLSLLKQGGIIVLVIYTGHSGGKEEKNALLSFTSRLDFTEYNVLHYHFVNQLTPPPEVLAVKKR